jgi:hypothetical protein
MPGGNIRAISVDAQGVVWAGTQKGVVRIDGDRVQVSNVPGMPGGLITALEHDHQGNLWIGTIEGIRVLRGDHVQSIDLAPLGAAAACSASTSWAMRCGSAATAACTAGRTVRWRGSAWSRACRWTRCSSWCPTASATCGISSNRGVLRTDMATLCGGRRPHAAVVVERYNEIDGMANAQANGSSGPSAILRQDGTFWVVTAGGLSTVDPQRLQRFRERPSPPAAIESVQVDGAPVHWEGPDRNYIPGGRRLAVSYVGLSYLMSDRIRYRTRLDGLDAGWVERGPQRSVEFVGLPPGDYTCTWRRRIRRGLGPAGSGVELHRGAVLVAAPQRAGAGRAVAAGRPGGAVPPAAAAAEGQQPAPGPARGRGDLRPAGQDRAPAGAEPGKDRAGRAPGGGRPRRSSGRPAKMP